MILESIVKLSPIIVVLIPLIERILTSPNRLQAEIRTNSESLKNLTNKGPAYIKLNTYVELQIDRLRILENESRRDAPMFAVAIVLFPILCYLTYWLFSLQEWWSLLLMLPAGFLAIIFLYGIFEAGQRVPRDNRGIRQGLNRYQRRDTSKKKNTR